MGSCAAPSAKGDDKFITTDYLQQCRGRCTSLDPFPACSTRPGFFCPLHPCADCGRQAGLQPVRQLYRKSPP
ncbi:hypothetical protein HW02_33070 [Pseudomonas aeruginosa]|nr:hypothetical protein HW02_33070 [Pseudomonas aeruginosa]